jgi:hypothetical protein
MQFLPVLASSEDGIWIEICSDFGPAMIQIENAEGQTRDNPICPECEDCTLCAPAAPSMLATEQKAKFATRDIRITGLVFQPINRSSPRHLRPVSRGPPMKTKQSTARLPRLPLAQTQFDGGSPWT